MFVVRYVLRVTGGFTYNRDNVDGVSIRKIHERRW